jgi:predicted DNA-binding transcriptional regulator YafY
MYRMSRHLERLLGIDRLLRAVDRHTTGSLAERLEVSERTIRNDIAFLRDRFAAPIEFTKRKGFYYTNSDWRLPTIPLSRGELFALTVGARMLEAYAGSAYTQDLRSAINRLAERLPEKAWVDLQQLVEDKISFSAGALVNLDPDIWHRLEDACQQSLRVWMNYFTASRNAFSDRKFDPYLLHIYRGTNPYVIGYCHKRQDIRWFRVDRIQSLEILEEKFEKDPEFDARKYLDDIFQCEVGAEAFEVKIWFDASTAPYISERHWHSTQVIEKHTDGSITLQMTVRGLNDLKRWVLGYGKGAIVESPPELRQLVKEEIKNMKKNYENIMRG